jgi:NADH dehydrogenase/NADH:ubiquinone oxidoreductase subunit G
MPVRFHIDEFDVAARPGESVLDAARREGIDVPALCRHDSVAPIGACRLCIVEADTGGRARLTTSCDLAPAEGMRVSTDTPEIRAHRAMNLELLLARAPGSKVIRSLAAKYGVKSTRFTEPDGTVLPNCILCELCLRVCERLGHSALGASGRGEAKRIGPPFGVPSDACVGCGSCAAVCPTSCITVRDTHETRLIWGKRFDFHKCSRCGAPTVTVEHRAFALAGGKLPADYYELCETCRQAEAARRFAAVVW